MGIDSGTSLRNASAQMNRLLSCIAVMLALAADLPAATRPNIIVFLVDDYDKYETSVYGGKVLTPNLERLAREGITFNNAHVTST
ncbi:MAG: sulfatase-like hydrolase/transferase, partial [Verrucomicrobiales bacterium]